MCACNGGGDGGLVNRSEEGQGAGSSRRADDILAARRTLYVLRAHDCAVLPASVARQRCCPASAARRRTAKMVLAVVVANRRRLDRRA